MEIRLFPEDEELSCDYISREVLRSRSAFRFFIYGGWVMKDR